MTIEIPLKPRMYARPEKVVYLSGPIAGLSYEDARNGWRKEFDIIVGPGISSLSPMRGKDALKEIPVLGAPSEGYEYGKLDVLTSNKGILARDFNDVRTCDAMVVNVLGVERVSIGTCVEVGWANAMQKPIVIVIEKEGNVHDHIFLTQTAGYRVESVAEAARVMRLLLTPGV